MGRFFRVIDKRAWEKAATSRHPEFYQVLIYLNKNRKGFVKLRGNDQHRKMLHTYGERLGLRIRTFTCRGWIYVRLLRVEMKPSVRFSTVPEGKFLEIEARRHGGRKPKGPEESDGYVDKLIALVEQTKMEPHFHKEAR